MKKKLMYIECNMGVAGDMLTAALLELHPDKDAFMQKLKGLGLKDVDISYHMAKKVGITGTQMSVSIAGEEETSIDIELGSAGQDQESGHQDHHHHHHDHDHHHADHGHSHHHHDDHGHDHHHNHDHHGHHHHNSYPDIKKIVQNLNIPEEVKIDVISVYRLIAEAESKAHGLPIDQVHFHEVGMMDAVADIVAVALLIRELDPDKIITSPIHLGSGQVKCAHGILPVPVPAVEYILKGVPTYMGDIKGELCTPTGAALVKHFTDEYGPMPHMEIEKVGYGLGKKDFPVANMVRVFMGTEVEDITNNIGANYTTKLQRNLSYSQTGLESIPGYEQISENYKDEVIELKANLDDMTGEEMAYLAEVLMEAGALDVYYQSALMKKGRPAYVITCLSKPEDAVMLGKFMLEHSSTFGVRMSLYNRLLMERIVDNEDTSMGQIRVKSGKFEGMESDQPLSKVKLEYDDLADLAKVHKLPLREVHDQLKKELDN